MSLEAAIQKAWKNVLDSATMYRKGFEAGVRFYAVPRTERFRKILVLGMGGSGIVGDIISNLKAPSSSVIFETVKNLRVPAYVGPDVLVIAISYSGDTTETNLAFIDAFSRGAELVGVSSGGRLSSSMRIRGLKVLEISAGFQPRFAVPEMVGAVYGLLLGFDGFHGRAFMDSVEELEKFAANFVDPIENMAAKVASELVDRPVVGLGSENIVSALLRLKCQLNENAKHPCYFAAAPEAFHNEVEGWTMTDKFAYVFVRSGYEHPMVAEALDWAEERVKSLGAKSSRIFVPSSSFQSEILKLIFFVDLISISLARFKKVNPLELNSIPLLRPLLRKYLP